MRLRSSLTAALCGLLLLLPIGHAQAPTRQPLTDTEVGRAVESLRKDANLGGKKTIRSLHWIDSKEERPEVKLGAWTWLANLFGWANQGARALIWVLGSVLVGICAVWIIRLIRRYEPSTQAAVAQAPSHVQNLDVRPDSLPEDVGAAAHHLLEAGRLREALALLYRGALSRAIHRHAVEIAESFTEGEVLRAVKRSLPASAAEYFARLLALWQREVYAAEHPPSEPIAILCREFAPVMDGVV